MRPEPKDPTLDIYIIFGTALIFALAYTMDACESDPRNDIKKSCAKTILHKAHEEAVTSVDTLDFYKCRVDLDAARKDSASATKRIQKLVKQMYGHKQYTSYEIDPTSKRVISPNQTRYSLVSRFDTKKAMQFPEFAKNYKQYQHAIQQLEIARRRHK